jgi:ATP-binding cassette, subfamily B, multidrug efflux pump
MNSANTQSTFRSFLRLLSLSKPDRGSYSLLIAAALLSTVLGLGMIEAARRMITGTTEQSLALIYSGMLIGLAALVLQFMNQHALAWLKATCDNRSTARLQLRLLKVVSTLPMLELAQYHSSDLYGRITDSVAKAQDGLNDKLVRFVTNLVQLGVAFAYFGWLNLPLTLGMIGFALAFPMLTYPLTGRLRRQHDRRHAEAAHSDEFLQDAIQGGLNVRALSIRALFLGKFREKLDQVRKRDLIIAAYDGAVDYANRAFLFGGMLFTLGLGGYQVLQGSLTIGGLTAFVAASGKLTGPVQSIAGMWNELIASISHTSRFAPLLELPEVAAGKHVHHARPEHAGVSLQVSQLSYAYPNGRLVLQDINLTIAQGELTAIIGTSGSGKSTLLKLLARLEEPASGRIDCNHSPLHRFTPDEWYARIALIPQESVLFTGTIRDNIQFGREDASQEDIELAARLAQIHDRIMQLPGSYETRVGETEGRLSGGEMQRVALARAFVRNPALLLLDEPTAALDPVTEAQVMAALHRFRVGRTTVFITHKLSLAQQADQIVVLKDGKVAESGSHAQLMNRRGRYYTWISEQAAEGREQA